MGRFVSLYGAVCELIRGAFVSLFGGHCEDFWGEM